MLCLSPRQGHRYSTDTRTLLRYFSRHHYRLHILVSLYTIHGHACILSTVISYRHLIHLLLLLHVLVPSVSRIRYTCISYTYVTVTRVIYIVTSCTCRMNLFLYMLWLFLYFCCMGHCSWYMDISIFLLHGFSYYWYRYDTSVNGHECYWYAMCETKCHVDINHRATSRIPHL